MCKWLLRVSWGVGIIVLIGFVGKVSGQEIPSLPKPVVPDQIRAYCIDFNWERTGRAVKPFAAPGTWAEADPAAHVAWYKAVGANVIQTFAVSCNGYAWYKNGPVPEQPGLQHDFLREVVRLGHKEGMLVFGYFCVGANVKWAEDHPELNYPYSKYHNKTIVYNDEYLEYLSKSVSDAVKTTGIDGFMVDWLWMPNRTEKIDPKTTEKLPWLETEKKLYQQLMGEPFPGKENLTKEQETAYSRKALSRCWTTIRKAAKDANPDCIIWLTVSKLDHLHVIDSDMYKEADWLMNEAGDMKSIRQIQSMVGSHTRLISCFAAWNGKDPREVIPEALDAGVGLYGFTAPSPGRGGLVTLDKFMGKPVGELKGDERNIATLARFYHGVGLDAVWDGKDGFIAAEQVRTQMPRGDE